MKSSAAITVIRDVLAMALGAFVILHQELHGQANYLAWTFGTACVLGPAALATWNLARGNPARADTTGQSSQRQGEHSSP